MNSVAPAQRVCIAGVPRSGKTTVADGMSRQSPGLRVRHTDDVAPMGWSQASQHVSTWLDAAGPWVIEGVAVPRALRKWLARNPTGKPCDVVAFSAEPRVKLTPGQLAMAKGCITVWAEIVAELEKRGVQIVKF